MGCLEVIRRGLTEDRLVILQPLFLAKAAEVGPTGPLSVTGKGPTGYVGSDDRSVALGAGPCGQGGDPPHW